jgi:hypothetical protein
MNCLLVIEILFGATRERITPVTKTAPSAIPIMITVFVIVVKILIYTLMTIDILGIGQNSKNFFQLFSFHGLTVCFVRLAGN